jgi:hypothetical protein
MKNWWRHWRDHLFYALAADFSPPTSASGGQACVGRCLQVSGSPVDHYAAVVMFAGPALPGQQRRNNSDASLAENTADADRVVAANYLEHRNRTRIASPVAIGPAGEPITGILCVTETCMENRRYGFDTTSAESYNDLLYCITGVPGGTPSVDYCRCAAAQPPLIARANEQLPHLRVCNCDLSRPGAQPSEPGQLCP